MSNPVTIRQLLFQHWESLRKAGVSHWQLPSPDLPTSLPLPKNSPLTATNRPVNSEPSVVSVPTNPTQDNTEGPTVSPFNTTMTAKQRREELQRLASCVANCQRCQELATTRTQTVFGVGNPNARLMFIGEAPGADEDKQGEPFVGRAGQLLNKIIEACEWTREEIYICNILKCRPPGNRNPSPEEAANCREYLDGQIQAVNPEYIVCWGSIAAKNLLDSKDPIGKMRKRFYQYHGARVLCTYHPSYLLRNPAAKKDVWDDMKLLMAEMEKS